MCVAATPGEPRPLTGGPTERRTSCSKSLFFPKPWGLRFGPSLLVEETLSLADEPLCPFGAPRGDRPVGEGCVVPSGAQVRAAHGKAWSRVLGLGWVQPPASRATTDLEHGSHGGSECPQPAGPCCALLPEGWAGCPPAPPVRQDPGGAGTQTAITSSQGSSRESPCRGPRDSAQRSCRLPTDSPAPQPPPI